MLPEEFFTLLEKSGLLTAEQLDRSRRIVPDCQEAGAIARTLAHDGFLTRWQAAQLLAGRSAFFLGKYKLIDLLGRGGMGKVFLGEHTMMNRRVALKILSRHVSRDSASVERFLAEARTIAALDHPNIVHAYSIDIENDRYFLVMEYIHGPDLRRMVEMEGPLDFQRAADYMRQAADGLAHAHQRKMIHCDIKPSNLLLNNLGVVKILDLGLARLTGAEPTESAIHEQDILGSIDYAAPEQALGSPDLDHRADIYSLGCTFYYLLSGHPPFAGGTLPERIIRHQTQMPPRLNIERPDAPDDLIGIYEKMMAKRPEDRFQTAEELSRALAQWRPPARKPLPPPLKPVNGLSDSRANAVARSAAGDNGGRKTVSAAEEKAPAPAATDAPTSTWRKIIAMLAAFLTAAGIR
jgi:eukaryotic-like serine/threonine-protein kinase